MLTQINDLNAQAAPTQAVANADVIAVTPIIQVQDQVKLQTAAILTNGRVLFTVTGGSIIIDELILICATANDVTGSTFQLASNGVAVNGASSSLASLTPGAAIVVVTGTTPGFAVVYPSGAGAAGAASLIVPAGPLTAIMAVGPTTGTWSAYIRYRPLSTNVTVA